MINPVNHASSPETMARYKVEPYVVAADVYAVPPHTGRGGWTWYTGAAGWMYRLIVESLLGLKREGGRLRFDPCLPAEWDGFQVRYRYKTTMYQIAFRITVKRKEEMKVILDGINQKENAVDLTDDGSEHKVEIIL